MVPSNCSILQLEELLLTKAICSRLPSDCKFGIALLIVVFKADALRSIIPRKTESPNFGTLAMHSAPGNTESVPVAFMDADLGILDSDC